MNTLEFKLVSGISCEVRQMNPGHLRKLTQGDNLMTGEGLNMILQDCIIRIGSKDHITEMDVKKMLSVDRKKALVKIRQLTHDFDPKLSFTYDWSTTIKKQGIRKVTEHEANLKTLAEMKAEGVEEFEETPYKDVAGEKIELQELSEVEGLYVKMILPKSGKTVRFKFLDGAAEEAVAKIDKDKRSLLTAMDYRKPQYEHKTDKSSTWIELNIDKMEHMKDFEALSQKMKECEATIDTAMEIIHPELPQYKVMVDLVMQRSFFSLAGVL